MGTRTRFVSGIALVLGVIATLGIPAVAGDIHVPDSNATQGTCNVIPWGTSTEYRYQAVVPTTMMASGAVYITELGFAACNAGTFSATQCEIRMAHFTGATPSTTFQTNLEKDVTVVFSGPITFPYLANQWSDVGLTSGFQYNGVDSLGGGDPLREPDRRHLVPPEFQRHAPVHGRHRVVHRHDRLGQRPGRAQDAIHHGRRAAHPGRVRPRQAARSTCTSRLHPTPGNPTRWVPLWVWVRSRWAAGRSA